MDIEFKSVEELYHRIKPALSTKKEEMKRLGYNYINEIDIWNYLKEIKWKSSFNLSLSDMVNDVLNTDEIIIDRYLKSKLASINREIYFKGVQNEEK
ncbi:MAG: post-transcriptional regulator [Bacilli bacterium]